jgi:hypothetical protein
MKTMSQRIFVAALAWAPAVNQSTLEVSASSLRYAKIRSAQSNIAQFSN